MRFKILVYSVIILALFLRLFNFTNRIYFETDNSRDALVGTFAGDHLKFPLLGQVTSAGPFFYGPWWYWYLAIVSRVPLGVLTLWYNAQLLSFIFLLFIYLTAREIGGTRLAITAFILASVSPAQIGVSLSIWNPSIVPLLTLLTLYFLVRWYKSRLVRYLAGIGFFWGLSMTIHFQTILTFPILIMALIASFPNIRQFIIFVISVVTPFIPMVLFDLQYGWFNFRNIYFYLTVGQYNIWVPNRWLTYALLYWPKTWGEIIGGSQIMGALLLMLITLMVIIHLTEFKKYRTLFLVTVTFILEVIVYRYYRGERFVYYSFFSHAPVLLLSAWSIWALIKKQIVLGAILFIVVTSLSIFSNVKNFNPKIMTYNQVKQAKDEIYRQHPGETFEIYACKNTGYINGYALSFLIYKDSKEDLNGKKIGVCFSGDNPMEWRILEEHEVADESNWYNKSARHVYEDTLEWWVKNPPR